MVVNYSINKTSSFAFKKRVSRYLLFFACIFSNFSQLPTLMDNRIISLVYTALWLIAAVSLFYFNPKIPVGYFILPAMFDLLCVFFDVFLKTSYLSSNLFRPINLCVFIMIVGVLASKYFDYEDLKFISLAYIISSLVLALYIYFNIFAGIDWAGTDRYLYSSKNSAGQIFLIAIFLVVFLFLKKHKFISILLIVFFAMLIFMMKSRSTIVSLFIAIVFFVILVPKKTWQKLFGIFVIAFAVFLVFKQEDLYNLFIKEIMLNNKDISDITAISSERDLHLEYFRENFSDYWLMGTGGTYLESFPLAVLMSYGVFLGIPVLLFSILPLLVGINYVNKKQVRFLCLIVIILSLIMLTNGIFEEQSPFGPGVKCYFLWLVAGLLIGTRKSQRNNVGKE